MDTGARRAHPQRPESLHSWRRHAGAHYRLKHQRSQTLTLGPGGKDDKLKPVSGARSGAGRDPVKAKLSEVVATMNDLFDGDFTEADFLTFAHSVRDKMVENPMLKQQAAHNTKEQFALGEFQQAMVNVILANVQNHGAMARQVFEKDEAWRGFASVMLDLIWEVLRTQREGQPNRCGLPNHRAKQGYNADTDQR